MIESWTSDLRTLNLNHINVSISNWISDVLKLWFKLPNKFPLISSPDQNGTKEESNCKTIVIQKFQKYENRWSARLQFAASDLQKWPFNYYCTRACGMLLSDRELYSVVKPHFQCGACILKMFRDHWLSLITSSTIDSRN